MKDRKANKVQIAKATEVVRQVIHEWDPYGLLAMGAPQDEWDSEIRSLVDQVGRIACEKDAALAISRIFSSAFQPEGFGDQCLGAV